MHMHQQKINLALLSLAILSALYVIICLLHYSLPFSLPFYPDEYILYWLGFNIFPGILGMCYCIILRQRKQPLRKTLWLTLYLLLPLILAVLWVVFLCLCILVNMAIEGISK